MRLRRQPHLLVLGFTALVACSSYGKGILQQSPSHHDASVTNGGGTKPADASLDANTSAITTGTAGTTEVAGMSGSSGVGGMSSSGAGGGSGSGASGTGAGGGACYPNPDTTNEVCTYICPEKCNGIDDNCNRLVDEDPASQDCIAPHASTLCNRGACVVTACLDGFRDCDSDPSNGCEVAATDINNCGLCGHVCSVKNGVAACVQGACASSGCNAGFLDCDSDPLTCETPNNTLNNCSVCGKECKSVPNATPSCTTGSCGVETCNTGFGDCDGSGVNGCEQLLNTLTDCGACAKACSFPGTQASCTNSAQLCTATACDLGYDECDGNPQDGCESLKTASNCGQCGKACSVSALQNVSSAECGSGSCVIQCQPGWGDCDGDAQTGCETKLDSITHCGACAACPALANAVTACVAGACTLANCTQGYGDCTGGTADGCETALDSKANCGACGTLCTKLSCGGGICTAIDCSLTPGYADCNGDGVTCETNVASDLNNCGACGNKCAFDASVTTPNATLTCTAQGCGTSCAAGYGDCDGNYKNGCETALTTLTNCGTCGQGCAIANASAACATGSCLVATCNQDYADCDSDKKSCETALNTPAHCGGCSTVCNLANAVAGCGGTPSARVCTVTGCSQTYYKNCDGLASSGCEVDSRSDVKNCASCGTDCSALPGVASVVCASSACSITACAAGFGDCTAAAGCETNLHTLQNCGACGVTCSRTNATATCASGTCGIATCNSGFGNCDGNQSNGCELPLGTQTNCSACGDRCTGFCKNGSCAACTSAADCNDGNACTVDTCNAGVCSWPAASAGTVCRAAAAGSCDAAEVCAGTGAQCPADALAPAGTLCRAAVPGGCDVAETCAGGTINCPSDTVVAVGTVCRASTGTCDGAEVCNGTNACPADTNFAASTTVCRGTANVCDKAENCTGSSNACPSDAKLPNTTVCRAAAGVCDTAEKCDGVSDTCPSDAKLPATTVCRAAVAGGCDVTETCTGTTNACPTDVVVAAGTMCRVSTGTCDVAETCPGSSNACPTDTHYAPNTTVCYVSQGACDNGSLNCTGSSNACPSPTYKVSTTVCRASTGACDGAEQCTGSTAACPADTNYASSATVCRAAVAGGCDVAESCTGSSNACPGDTVIAGGTVCRASTGTCDLAETCNGTNACPANTNYAPNTTQCYASGGPCDNGNLNCTGSSNTCPSPTYKASTTVCRATAGSCDVAEQCTGSAAACPADVVASAGTLCRGQSNTCDAAEYCSGSNGSCPTDGFAPVNTDCGYTGGLNDLTVYSTGLVSGTNANVQDFATTPGGYASSLTNPASTALVPPAVATGWGSDVAKFTVTAPSGANVDYWRWISGNGTGSGSSRALQAADFIEYDVYIDANIDGIGGVDAKTNHSNASTTGCGSGSCSYLRDWTGWVDQNGVGGHPATNIAARAYGKWYHRRLPVPAGLVGNTITYFDVVDEHDGNAPATRTAYFDNLIISQTPGGCTGGSAVCLAKAGSTCSSSAQCISNNCISNKCSACPDCEIGGVCYANNAANPGNACQTCQTGVSRAAWSSIPNGTSCNDGNACTYSDVCTSGSCGGTAITCASTTCQSRTCNGTSSCTVANAGSGTACTDDGNVCTTDTCDGSGTCAHPAGHAGTTCRAAAGACDVVETCTGSSATCPTDTIAANGTACSNTCDTVASTCNGSSTSCSATSPVTCQNLDPQCHTAGTCNSGLGSCPITTRLPDGTVCNDGNGSTTGDICTNGTCAGRPACTVDAQCGGNQYCNAGTCATKLAINAACTAASQCQSAVCSASKCQACTWCYGSSSSNNCDDNNPATTDTCATGCNAGCQHATVANGTACASDNNPCSTDAWSSGNCAHTAGNAGALCGKSGDFCISDATCDGVAISCPSAVYKATGTVCNDNNARTTGDVCNTGICKGN